MNRQKKLMSKIGVENFSIRDVIKPEPLRLRRDLSALINFAKFREDRMVLFEECTYQSVRLARLSHVQVWLTCAEFSGGAESGNECEKE